MKKYEIMYIVNASLDEEQFKGVQERLHATITSHEGSIDKVDDWGIKDFAYEIEDYKRGYYVIFDVSVSAEGIAEFARLANINANVIRHMIIRK